jgi:hypothetical protein
VFIYLFQEPSGTVESDIVQENETKNDLEDLQQHRGSIIGPHDLLWRQQAHVSLLGAWAPTTTTFALFF